MPYCKIIFSLTLQFVFMHYIKHYKPNLYNTQVADHINQNNPTTTLLLFVGLCVQTMYTLHTICTHSLNLCLFRPLNHNRNTIATMFIQILDIFFSFLAPIPSLFKLISALKNLKLIIPFRCCCGVSTRRAATHAAPSRDVGGEYFIESVADDRPPE